MKSHYITFEIIKMQASKDFHASGDSKRVVMRSVFSTDLNIEPFSVSEDFPKKRRRSLREITVTSVVLLSYLEGNQGCYFSVPWNGLA